MTHRNRVNPGNEARFPHSKTNRAGIDVHVSVAAGVHALRTDTALAIGSVRLRSAVLKRRLTDRPPQMRRLANLSNCLGNLKFTCVYLGAFDPISLVAGEPT
jgi:hypothetical protein